MIRLPELGRGYAWIGLKYDENKNGWYWVDGVKATSLNTNWNQHEEFDAVNKSEHCGSYVGGTMHSWSCAQTLSFAICERTVVESNLNKGKSRVN